MRKAGIASDFSFLDQLRPLEDEVTSGLPVWMDRARGDRLLATWGTTHRLERNLWKSVREAGLPLPAGVKCA